MWMDLEPSTMLKNLYEEYVWQQKCSDTANISYYFWIQIQHIPILVISHLFKRTRVLSNVKHYLVSRTPKINLCQGDETSHPR